MKNLTIVININNWNVCVCVRVSVYICDVYHTIQKIFFMFIYLFSKNSNILKYYDNLQ